MLSGISHGFIDWFPAQVTPLVDIRPEIHEDLYQIFIVVFAGDMQTNLTLVVYIVH